MSDIHKLVKKVQIPNQLKSYFIESESILEYLTDDKLFILEDLYIYFDSIYEFDTSEFCVAAVAVIRRPHELDSFYYYLKKVIEKKVDLQTKDKNRLTDKSYIHIEKILLDQMFKESADIFIDNIDKLIKKEDVALSSLYKSIGKLELITDITSDHYFEKLKNSGEMLIEEYLKTLVKESE